jgi:hypothetical protein
LTACNAALALQPFGDALALGLSERAHRERADVPAAAVSSSDFAASASFSASTTNTMSYRPNVI